MEEKHVADYFVVSGVPEGPDLQRLESKPLINPVLPITDITVIFKSLGEQCPTGYNCIEHTPEGHLADLNNGNIRSPNIQICYRRGTDKPPLTDIGVYHEDRDCLLKNVEVVRQTPYGRCASTGTSGAKCGTYLTYRRAKDRNLFNQLVVVDLCVILNNKSEHPPHAFYAIKKNLNKSLYGMIGSEVFLCYKKTILSPPSICFTPQIISRFPLQDYANFPLPDSVPLFCLPAGANIELRPTNQQLPPPSPSTFVLTSDSARKIYGTALSFYEPIDKTLLRPEQRESLGIVKNSESESNHTDTFVTKSICILSRWPFFECFETFLNFLHSLVFYSNIQSNVDSPQRRNQVPLEHYISHFLLEVSFPTPQRPTVLVQLKPGSDDNVIIRQPSSRLPLPPTGASFIKLLDLLGVENVMNVFLFGLCEQKILLHSLHPYLLTGVAEAITAMLFPFHWQCPYVPLCPLSLHEVLNAPLPFIVGIDSRCFDTFTPPEDVICIDLDTRSIFLSESKKALNLRILPKRAARVLRSSLEIMFQKCKRLGQMYGSTQSPQRRSAEFEANRRHLEETYELEIQEIFLRFMATILKGFRSFLLPIIKPPTVGATDPTSLFNFDEFLMSRDRSYSQFYQLITKTQMFTHYIEERSFVSDKDTSLAFFDDCEERLTTSNDMYSDRPMKLFNKDTNSTQTDRSVYVPAPEHSPSISMSNNSINLNDNVQTHKQSERKPKFNPLDSTLFHRHPQFNNFPSLDKAFYNTDALDGQLCFNTSPNERNNSFSICRRTKQEIKTSQRLAKRSADTPLEWSKYLVSCCFGLWFATLPSYISFCKSKEIQRNPNGDTKSIAKILRYAYSTIVKMQKLQLNTDEVCFRVLTLLCGHHGQPALAVRVFLEMKKSGIKPNVVTYGYYNKAVLESQWPEYPIKPTTLLWAKIRNVISGIALFKTHGRLRMERRSMRCIPLISDPKFPRPYSDSAPVDQIVKSAHPTKLAVVQTSEYGDRFDSYGNKNHRRSMVNRSFSTYHKCSIDTSKSGSVFEIAQSGGLIQKSHSMHFDRDTSSEDGDSQRSGIYSSNCDDEEEPIIPKRYAGLAAESHTTKKISTTYDLFVTIREKHQLIFSKEPNSSESVTKSLNLIDNSAGILFKTDPSTNHLAARSTSQSPININSDPEVRTASVNHTNSFLKDQNLSDTNHILNPVNIFNTNNFGEDVKILSKLNQNAENQTRNFTEFADRPCRTSHKFSDDTQSNQLSESMTSEQSDTTSQEDDPLKNLTSTPNFRLASLINDASNLQWSRWTTSQNSKSVYKGIKSAATGIVSSLQEFRSSFSISNSATPSKFLNSAQSKSVTSREMLSRWANYFSSQTSERHFDDDGSENSGLDSNELLNLSNDEDAEPYADDSTDTTFCQEFFDALEKHYNNSSSKEDLVDHLSSEADINGGRVAIQVLMTTCSRCNICHSLLYDEEIMEKWSHNESNLNTRCVYCRARIVPMMNILVEDLRPESEFCNNKDSKKCHSIDKSTECLIDIETSSEKESTSDDSAVTYKEAQAKGSKLKDTKKKNRNRQSSAETQQQLTVPYLSPIVLRKELENVFESSGDTCPAGDRFVDEHPIIYWNLLWYSSRTNLPTHLALLCLTSKSILNGKELQSDRDSSLDTVVVKTLWDNENLHSEIGRPLYRLLNRETPSIRVRAIICDELYFSNTFLRQVIDLIKNNELEKAMVLVLNARLKSSPRFSFDKNRHNLYRDLMFLINIDLGPGKIYKDNFEREYKKAFKSLNFQQVALNRFDRPPTTRSLFCRKCFKEPSLCVS